ncbi:MAG: hypothetical protein ABIQ63_12095, partial [Rhodanobacter sp.]
MFEGTHTTNDLFQGIPISRETRTCTESTPGRRLAVKTHTLARSSSDFQTSIRDELDFAFYLHRNIEGKLGKAYGAATVGTDIGAIEFKDEVRKSV